MTAPSATVKAHTANPVTAFSTNNSSPSPKALNIAFSNDITETSASDNPITRKAFAVRSSLFFAFTKLAIAEIAL